MLVLAAGACGSSSKPSATSVTTSQDPLTTTTTDTVAPSSTTTSRLTTSSSTTVPSTGTRCHTSQLQARVVASEGAAGTIHLTVALVNTSKAACTIQGYPGVAFQDAAGHSFIDDPVRDPALPPGATLGVVRVQPGQSGQFVLSFNDVERGSAPCSTATRVIVTPPDETDPLVVSPSAETRPCGDARVGPVTRPS